MITADQLAAEIEIRFRDCAVSREGRILYFDLGADARFVVSVAPRLELSESALNFTEEAIINLDPDVPLFSAVENEVKKGKKEGGSVKGSEGSSVGGRVSGAGSVGGDSDSSGEGV